MKDTYTIKEVSERLGINQQGVRVQIQRGLLPGLAVPSVQGRSYRYIIPKEAFEKFMRGEKT